MDNYLEVYKPIAENFNLLGEIQQIKPIGNGHINVSLLIKTDKGEYLMQNINTYVFPDVEKLMNNISLVTQHLKDKKIETLNIVLTKTGKTYFMLDNLCYRVYDFIKNGITYDTLKDAKMFENVGKAFGNFQNALSDFDASLLSDTIPNFHNTPKRYDDFAFSVIRNKVGRADSCLNEISFVKERKGGLNKITRLMSEGKIPVRVTHNDTKLNNVVLDELTGMPRAVIDLDTVMTGSMLYDFGDSLRFGASTALEDEKDLSKVHFDLNLFSSFANGFCSTLKKTMTDKERELLPYSVYLMCMECGIRFLTDYLDGDSYFKVGYSDHNLIRARTQFKLAKEVEENFNKMKIIIDKIFD